MMNESSLTAQIESGDKCILDHIRQLRTTLEGLEGDIQAGRRCYNRTPLGEAPMVITGLVSTREVLLAYRKEPTE
jgi:hypothetical protein